MKKNYQKPTMNVEMIQDQCQILSGSDFSKVGCNSDLGYGGGGDGNLVRSRSFGGWNDEDE